jgi:hypothetical protein
VQASPHSPCGLPPPKDEPAVSLVLSARPGGGHDAAGPVHFYLKILQAFGLMMRFIVLLICEFSELVVRSEVPPAVLQHAADTRSLFRVGNRYIDGESDSWDCNRQK